MCSRFSRLWFLVATGFEPGANIANNDHFRWQNGHGVLSFGAKQLAYVVAYIEQQKQHHAEKTIQPYLEQIE